MILHTKGRWASSNMHSKDFVNWFKERIELKLQLAEVIPEHVKWLSKGPPFAVKKYTGYYVNGFRFHTMKRDGNVVTQNSGVTLTAITHSFSSSKDQNPIVGDIMYYGSLEDIIELSYHGHFRVVLFRCVWFQSKKDNHGLTLVNMKKKIYEGEVFILATQAHQVFYVQDLRMVGIMLFVTHLENYQMVHHVAYVYLYVVHIMLFIYFPNDFIVLYCHI